jgi:hypothetical protein
MKNVIKIPKKVAQEPDLLAQAVHKLRTPCVVDLLWQDVRRTQQHQAFRLSAGVWNPAHHPELTLGGAAYVETIRSEHTRFQKVVRRNQSP